MKKKKTKKYNSIILRLFILLVCGYFTVTLGSLWGNLNDSMNELEALKVKHAVEQNEINELKAMLASESNTPLIEKAARERLGYVYPDEQVFIDISGD